MDSFITWLNKIQGLIEFLSLIVAIIGFITVNKSIKTYKQSQQSGDNSINQQANDGGINQNTGKNIT